MKPNFEDLKEVCGLTMLYHGPYQYVCMHRDREYELCCEEECPVWQKWVKDTEKEVEK